jgi:hypothetical protein
MANRFDIHPCDLRHKLDATVPKLLSLQGDIPTSLLLIQAAEKQVHLVVQFLIWMIACLLALWTLTLVYGSF